MPILDIDIPQILPYSKTDKVAKLDAPRPPKPTKQHKPKPAVPARHCAFAADCQLRKSGKCDPLWCATAHDHVTNHGAQP